MPVAPDAHAPSRARLTAVLSYLLSVGLVALYVLLVNAHARFLLFWLPVLNLVGLATIMALLHLNWVTLKLSFRTSYPIYTAAGTVATAALQAWLSEDTILNLVKNAYPALGFFVGANLIMYAAMLNEGAYSYLRGIFYRPNGRW